MKYKIVKSSRFKKDYKLCKKRYLPLDELKKVIVLLANGVELEEKYKDHTLVGNYVNYRECHIQPDWILIYQINDDELFLYRTGSHSDLFY